MYYKEEIIDGVLSYRDIPDGEWHPLTPERLTKRIVELNERISSLIGEIEEMNQRDFHEAEEN